MTDELVITTETETERVKGRTAAEEKANRWTLPPSLCPENVICDCLTGAANLCLTSSDERDK